MEVKCDWESLKEFVLARSLSIQYVDYDGNYYLSAHDGNFSVSMVLSKEDSDNLTDFETNFKASGNSKIIPTDTDGSVLNRAKTTKTGWHYQPHCIEFQTSDLGSNYNKDSDGNDLGFTTLKLYNSSNEEITSQATADLTCVKTVIDWMPNHDYEIIGGKYFHASLPAQDLRLWVIGIPDIPSQYGGSVPFSQGGINLRYVGTGNGLDTDGRSSKFLPYHAVNKTNKLRVILKHSAGFKHKGMFIWEIYKAP